MELNLFWYWLMRSVADPFWSVVFFWMPPVPPPMFAVVPATVLRDVLGKRRPEED